MSESRCCGTCSNHGPSDGGSGQCRALPPTEPDYLPTAVPPLGATVMVKVRTYIRTADTLPACGHYRPAAEPEPVRAETKPEKIERLRREGCTDLAAWKRALEGR